MCQCTPGIRTPFCGKPGCVRPQSDDAFSPHYPKRIAPDLVLKRVVSGSPGGFSYAADLTDGYHTVMISGAYRDTEQEAIRALGVSVSQKAELLRVRAVELMEAT